MDNSTRRRVSFMSCILIFSLVLSFLPIKELKASIKEPVINYNISPLQVTYEQKSKWSNFTQDEYTITNTSEHDISEWTIELLYPSNTVVTNIWNASDVTDYAADEHINISGNTLLSAGQTHSFGLIAEGAESTDVVPIDIKLISYVSDASGEADNSSVLTSDEAEPAIFPYAIFSGSEVSDFTFSGWKSNIAGDVYSGRNFIYQARNSILKVTPEQ